METEAMAPARAAANKRSTEGSRSGPTGSDSRGRRPRQPWRRPGQQPPPQPIQSHTTPW
jgi:hypothetical protein